MLAYGLKEIPDDAVNIIERFVILLFDRTSTCTKVDYAKSSYHENPRCNKSRLPELL